MKQPEKHCFEHGLDSAPVDLDLGYLLFNHNYT